MTTKPWTWTCPPWCAIDAEEHAAQVADCMFPADVHVLHQSQDFATPAARWQVQLEQMELAPGATRTDGCAELNVWVSTERENLTPAMVPALIRDLQRALQAASET